VFKGTEGETEKEVERIRVRADGRRERTSRVESGLTVRPGSTWRRRTKRKFENRRSIDGVARRDDKT